MVAPKGLNGDLEVHACRHRPDRGPQGGRKAQTAIAPAEDQTHDPSQLLDVLDVRDRQRQPRACRWLIDA